MNMNILIFFPQSLKTCIFFTVIFHFDAVSEFQQVFQILNLICILTVVTMDLNSLMQGIKFVPEQTGSMKT